jgi:hypothetical protein
MRLRAAITCEAEAGEKTSETASRKTLLTCPCREAKAELNRRHGCPQRRE